LNVCALLKKGKMVSLFGIATLINNVRYRGVDSTTKTQALRTLDKKRSEILSGEIVLVANVQLDGYIGS